MSSTLVSFTNSWIISPSNHHHLQTPQVLFYSNRLFPLPRRINFLSHEHQFPCTCSLQRSALENPNTYGFEDSKDSTISREDEELEQAREVVSEILQNFGVSKEESIEIALNSPKYIKMLTDGVRELDDLSLWNSWSSKEGEGEGGEVVESGTQFKKKVYHMAKKKRDKGMLPLLETVGLSLSSSMHLARYLSSQTLPNVILKVKYMKEILFSGSNDRPIGKNARRMMMHLSIPVDEDLQQTLSFFEKIQARRGGLDLLDVGDVYFRYLIESFPRLLLLQVESKLMPKVEFLENIGVPKGCMRNIMLLFPPIVFYNIEKDIKPRIHAFEKVNIGEKDFGRMLVKYPWILSESIQENCEEILYFFDMHKVPKVSIERAIKSWPHILGCSTTNLKLMIEQFGELGIRDKKLGQVIAKSPQLLLHKSQEFLQVVRFLEELGLDEESVGKILGRCPEIFRTSIDTVLKKKIEFLIDMGVSRKHLPRVIKKYPDLFVCDIEKALRPRMKYLMESGGLSEREVVTMVCKFSPILGYSIEEVLRPKLEFLVKTMGMQVREVVEYPRFFSYSLEKKIQRRFWVLKSRNFKCSLKDMLAKNDDEFASEFILPPSLE